MIRAASALLLLVAALVLPSAAQAGEWRLAQPAAPAPPAGQPAVPFVTPLGSANELSFWSPDRGLMVVGGNDVVRKGIYRWDGRDWAPLATVCGTGPDDQPTIAWAGPDEFWVIADSRADTVAGSFNAGTLCHFKDGAFIASYASLLGATNAYQRMNAAACLAPDDCWFAGEVPADGDHPFRLHWNGTAMSVVTVPRGPAVLALDASQGVFTEAQANLTPTVPGPDGFPVPDPNAALFSPLKTIPANATDGGAFTVDPFMPAAQPSGGGGGSEITAIDHAGTLTWAVGGAASQNPPTDGTDPRGLLVALRVGNGPFEDLTLDPSQFPAGTTAWDVAAEPGTDRAWIALRGAGAGQLIEVDSTGTVLRRVSLPDPADPDPAAPAAAGTEIRAIDCPAADDCWAGGGSSIAGAGWLFHLTGGPDPGTNDDPAFHRLIVDRPGDGLSPVVFSDEAAVDDSGADPGLGVIPVEVIPDPVPLEPETPTGPTARSIKIKTLSRTAISISFRLTAKAKVRAYAYHGKKIVSRSARKTMRRGPQRVTLRVSTRRWPTRVRLDVKAP